MTGPGVSPGASLGADPVRRPSGTRITGVDATRGIALVGMMAVHVFPDFHSDGSPTAVMAVAGGRSAATFAFVAGISLAFVTGGRRPVAGQARVGAVASIAVRSALISVIGLALGYVVSDEAVILAYYGLIFLLAIPLLGLRPRALGSLAVLLSVIVPLFLLATGLPGRGAPDNNPTFGALVHHPLQRAVQLIFTGDYPASAWLVYICAGLAVGRLNLRSIRVAWALLGGGLALAVASWSASSLLLFHLGGLDGLRNAASSRLDWAEARNAILWDPEYVRSWWWLIVRAPYSVTPITLLSTLGVAMALLGAVLLATRVPAVARAARPVVAAGTMTLTLYCAHLLVLATGLLGDEPRALFVLLVAASLAFAVAWRRERGQGPLEAVVSSAAGGARWLLCRSIAGGRPRASKARRGARRAG